jgi:hypothetical protein
MRPRKWIRPRARSTKGMTPKDVLVHALGIVCGPWPKGEPIILQDPDIALDYMQIVRGCKRWPEAEEQFDKWTDAQIRRYFDLLLGRSRGRCNRSKLDELFEREGWA